MAGAWRLTRNRYGRAAYEALSRVGITATWMIEYVASLDDDRSRDEPSATVRDRDGNRSAVSVGAVEPAAVAPLDAPVRELVDGEEVLAATEDGRPLGYLFLSVDATHDVAPLERRVAFDGAYVRRVFVSPDERQRGVASALLDEALTRTRKRGESRATALVALDNRPSRALFESRGFRPVADHRYARLGPVSVRSTRDR